jgi:glycosyltransferase involved in cell wall biosynthesis
MKSIFFYYRKIFPITGGMSVHGYNLAYELNRQGFKLKTVKQRKSELFEILDLTNIPKLIKEINNCDYIYYRVPLHSFSKFERFLSYFPKRKKILEINAPIEELLSENSLKKLEKKHYQRYQWNLKQADKYVVVSKKLKDYLIGKWGISPEKILITSNGCNPDKYRDNFKGRTFITSLNKIVVFWAGNPEIKFHNSNNLYEILEAFKDRENLIFVIGGYNITNTTYKNAIFLPKINYKEIFYYINDADILLALYGDFKWSPIGFYNSSVKFFDYWASGKPTIAPNMGQIKDIATHKENAYLYNDLDDIIYYIDELSKNREKRETIGKAGQKVAFEKYKWRDSYNKLADFIEGKYEPL